MNFTEFKDRLFDVLNDTDILSIADLEIIDHANQIKVTLDDGSQFMLTAEAYGRRYLITP